MIRALTLLTVLLAVSYACRQLDQFENILADDKGKWIVIDFIAQWCLPCRTIGPKFNQLADTYTDVEFLVVDLDECYELAERYNINAVPTFKFIKDGNVHSTLIGASEDKLYAAVAGLK